MIAQVWTSTGPAGPPSAEVRRFIDEVLAQARAFDGCEAVMTLADPSTGESLAINLFRDRAAMDAFQAFSKEKSAESESHGAKVGAPHVYSEVTALL